MAGWQVLLPILLPLIGAALSLLFRRFWRVRVGIALTAMLGAMACSTALLFVVSSSNQPVIFQVGGWKAPIGITIIADFLSAFLVFMSQLVFCAGILYAMGCKDKCIRYPAFYPLFLLMVSGLTGAFLAGDLFNLFVFAELLVISTSVLTAISDDRLGVEAAYKYFILSLIASIFLLISCGTLYATYGTLNMADLARRIALEHDLLLTSLAMVFLMAFFMVKSAVIPFHFWQPDLYTASPTPVSAMLSSVVGKLGIYGILRMLTLLFIEQSPTIRILLVILGSTGVILGGLGAIGTGNAKRMLAYSTIGQLGFILVAIGWGTQLALVTALIFIFNHSLIKSSLLMLTGAMASQTRQKNAGFETLEGIGKAKPVTGLLFILGGIALAGMPPMNGFINKLSLFTSGIDAGEYISLAVLGVASILTIIYVIRAFNRIWFHAEVDVETRRSPGDRLGVPIVLVSLCLVLGIWASPLVNLTQRIATWLADPTNYILAVIGK